ncbi:MAG TPA: Hint domain-containing protein [Roseomonas sp.]|nr:Hint domain-containing protein [Roseomonas sp.]
MSGTGTWTPSGVPTAGNDTFTGSSGADYADALGGNDSLLGLGGDDFLIGGDGNDTLDGGTGRDVMSGGNGDDSLVWHVGDTGDAMSPGTGNDTIYLEGWTGDNTDPWTLEVVPGMSLAFATYNDGTTQAVVDIYGYRTTGLTIVCFAEGTRIATARGEVPVEALRIGDLAVTAHGTGTPLQPIAWIGHTRADIARHPNPAAIAPILIRAGALADGVPHRDLRVSPEHAMFLDGRLVPARLLVNGTSIIQETWRQAVTYWHVELPAHGLLVAEGAVSESYLDDGNRKHFDNGTVTTLFKDFAAERGNGRYAERACRPQLLDGPGLDSLRARIAARAGQVVGEERRSA